MPSLLDHDERVAELIRHIGSREGLYNYFYCDHNDLVTIGIGTLVDRGAGANLASRQTFATNWIRQHWNQFSRQNGNAAVTQATVLSDWNRVREYGPDHPNYRARAYANVARLRITDDFARELARDEVERKTRLLHRRRPFTIDLDERIQMAFVDVLYNPSGVPLFGSRRRTQRLWNSLDPTSEDRDLERAATIFRRIWQNRGRAPYQARHRIRAQWFEQGVVEMQLAEGTTFTARDSESETTATRGPVGLAPTSIQREHLNPRSARRIPGPTGLGNLSSLKAAYLKVFFRNYE